MSSEPSSEKPSKYTIYMSAMLPGLGQLIQRRWVAGILFLVLFVACFLALLCLVLGYLLGNLKVAVDSASGDMSGPFPASPLVPIVVCLLLAILVYIINICDAMLAYVRSYRIWAEQRLVEKFLKLCVIVALGLTTALPGRADGPAVPRLDAGQAAVAANLLYRAIRNRAIMDIDGIMERYGREVAQLPIQNGVTPLHVAAAMNDDVATAILLAHGAGRDARTDGGFTPLHWAAGRDAVKTAKILIAIGTDVNIATPAGVTPAHWAADRNATNVLRLLILSGADIAARTDKGLTPIHWAIRKHSVEASQMLAFKLAVDEESQRSAPTNTATAGPWFQIEPDPEQSIPPVPQALPRAEFGRSLVVPLGRDQTLEFVWIESVGLWVGKYEVTNGQFRRFRYEHRSMFREEFSLDGDDQPVVYVSWNDAVDFCRWLNQSFSGRLPPACVFRLPTDQEWTTFAACGTDRKYPWGDTWPPKYGNLSDDTARKHLDNWQGITHYDDGHVVTCPVAESGANDWGIYGLAGNVWEWCEDWHGDEGKYKVRRGGSWDFDPEESLRLTAHGFDRITASYDTVGIRLVVGKTR